MQSFRQFQEALVMPDKGMDSNPSYYYHATNVENAHDIANSSLKTFGPHHGTDQASWPDGHTEKRAYFSPHANQVYQFAPEEGRAVILRVNRNAGKFKEEVGTGDVYSNVPIPASNLEILDDGKGWISLKSAF